MSNSAEPNSTNKLDNSAARFLRWFFDARAGRALVCSFAGDPSDKDKVNVSWTVNHAKTLLDAGRWPLPADHNQYFCVSLFAGTIRQEAYFKSLHVLAIDDVGDKEDQVAPALLLQRLGHPGWIIETSLGNYQWFYRFREPITDRQKATRLIGLISKDEKIKNDAKGLNRMMRLPGGRNRKIATCGPQGFDVRLISEPLPDSDVGVLDADELLTTFKDVAADKVFNGILTTKAARSTAECIGNDAIGEWLVEFGLVKGLIPSGLAVDITCPWVNEHGRGVDNGTAYFPKTGGFRCFHDHCVDRNWQSLKTWVEEELIRRGVEGGIFGARFEPVDDASVAGDADALAIDTPAYSEIALARRFVNQYADDLRFCAERGMWYHWREQYWQIETTLRAYDLARQVAETAAREVENKRDSRSIASAKTAGAIERIAKADRRFAVRANVWDVSPDILATPGGTVDLETGRLRSSRREEMITKLTAVTPDPNCLIPLWSGFLKAITAGDEELQGYLQRMGGYCLTGHTREDVLLFCYGTGSNGKSVFTRTLADILGDYTAIASMDMLIERKHEAHPTEVAHLWGARLAIAQENDRGHYWAEARIKRLTGSDRLTAHFMAKDFFDFNPTHKLLVAGNNKPRIRNVDEAIRRRIRLIPFLVTIPLAARDEKLREKLKTEWPGILSWFIAGAAAWYRDGLNSAKSVADASNAYFKEEDTLGAWLESCCKFGSQFTAGATELFQSWVHWATLNDLPAGSQTAFSQALGERFKKEHGRNGNYFIGLKYQPF